MLFLTCRPRAAVFRALQLRISHLEWFFRALQNCIEDNRIDRNVDEMTINPENYGDDSQIVKWIDDESNKEKGFDFIVRLREDILAYTILNRSIIKYRIFKFRHYSQ